MQKLINKYPTLNFEQEGRNTPEFLQFSRDFKSNLKTELAKVGATLIESKAGHFYISGFFKKGEQLYYFSWHNGDSNLMFRTAQHLKDWTGGSNQWVRMGEDMATQMRLR